MKRFVTKRKIKMKRYQLLFFCFFGLFVFLVLFKTFLSVFFGSISNEKMLSVVIENAYGNIFDDRTYQPYHSVFKNAFGFPFSSSKSVMEEKTNMKDFMREPMIYLYNTFQTDKYLSNYYSSYTINPVVVQANFIFQEYLKVYGYSSLVEEESVAKVLKENNLSYTLSYRGSRILLEEAKKQNPSLKYYFDLGLSDDKREATTFSSSESDYARILFIVGTEYSTSQENQEFARALNQKLEKLLPGLSRGVSLRGGAGYHGIYNQDFSNQALLIYIGGKENTIDEVNRSLKVLASAFHEYREENNEK